MAGLDDLANRLDRIAVRVEGNVERAMKDCAQVVLRSVVDGTPVDTGTARSNWTPELDRAFEGLFPARVPGIKIPVFARIAIARVQPVDINVEPLLFNIVECLGDVLGILHRAQNDPSGLVFQDIACV